MSQAHLVDHLDAAKKIAESSRQPFIVYLIEMAKDAAANAKPTRGRAS